jgi:hypothetical protein
MVERAEVGPQEVPRPPESIVSRLEAYDPRLELAFNTQHHVWQVWERLASGGLSHVLFWHDGPWNAMQFKDLPSGEHLIARISAIDWARRANTNPKAFMAEMRARGAAERAWRFDQARAVGSAKFRAAKRWYADNWTRLVRSFEMGGGSAKAAVRELRDARQDLLGGDWLGR